MSRSVDLEKLQREWPPLLQKIFAEYWPIVIGYDGNDRTLMRFLDHESLNGRLYLVSHVKSAAATRNSQPGREASRTTDSD